MRTKILLSILFVMTNMSIKAQVNVNVCSGENVFLHVASPALSSIQWQQMGSGSVFIDIVGATNDTLNIPNIQTGNFYRAKITGQTCAPYYTEIKSIVLTPLPIIGFSGLQANYCMNASPITLTGTPSGGSFSGNGMTGNVFSPLAAGPGTHTVTYSYTDIQTQCTGIYSQQVSIASLPTMANAGTDITASSTTVQLNGNTPVTGNGLWSIISGTGGSLGNPNNPQSSFTGTANSVYKLKWTITNLSCPASSDTLQIMMPLGINLPSVQCLTYTMYVHPSDNGTSVWGCSGMASGANSVDDGASNTAIVVQMCTLPNAANICDTLTAYGFNDWYLPSYNELDCLRQNASTIGGFSATTYWSSTEGSGILYLNAYYRTFPSGTSGATTKSGIKSIRCVRK